MAEFLLLKRGRFLNFTLTLIASFFLVTTGVVGQTVTTDKDDYSPGMYVIVTGTGWTPGETVSFDFHETPKVCTSDHHIRSTVADFDGTILYNQFLINEKHLGVAFVLTATGQSSGSTAVTQFTDAGLRNVSVIGSSFCAGDDITVSFEAVANRIDDSPNGNFGNSNNFLVQLSNAAGSFTNSVTILTQPGKADNYTVTATIPANTVHGSNYKIRVVSTQPASNEPDNGGNLTISAKPTAAYAGVDQLELAGTSTALAANAPTQGTGAWSIISGAGGSFGSASSASSPFSGTAGTTYILRWTTSNGACTSTDDVTISFSNTIATTTALASAVNPSVYAQTVTFTATVAPTSGTNIPTGNVIFKNGTATLGTVALATINNAQRATFTTTALAVNTSGHSITAVYQGAGNFQTSTSSVLSQVVNKSESTIAATGTATFTYNRTAQGPSTSNVIGSTGVVTYSYSGTSNGGVAYGPTATRPSLAGNYSVIATVAADDNYKGATSAPYGFTIGKAPLTVVNTSREKVYGNVLTASDFAGSINGIQANDNITVARGSAGSVANAAVNNYAIIGTLVDPDNKLGNYEVSNPEGILTVTKAALTVTADNKTKAYGAALPELTVSYDGLVNGDTAPATVATIATTATASSAVGSYAITASGAEDANYNISYVAGTLTVEAVDLVITADNKTKAYGAALPELTVSYSGLVNGDTAPATVATIATTATASSAVGSYAITASGAEDANYNISYEPGTLTVEAVDLVITADNKTKAYGAALPELTVSYSGLVNGDTAPATVATIATTATASSAVGSYAITASGAEDANYNISYEPGTLTVEAVDLVITADNKTKAYGAALPELTVSYDGLVNGDTAPATVATIATTATASSAVGSYAITASGAEDANYNISYEPGTLTVEAVDLVITADNKTKAYGAALPELTVSYDGLVNGDTAPATVATIVTTATASSAVGSYAITASGAEDANYNISYEPGTLTVEAVDLVITADNKTKAYGAALPELTVSYDGLVNGDTAPATVATIVTTATASSAVGSYAITASGAEDANYNISYVAGTLTVEAVDLVITADNKTKAYGAALPELTVSYSGLVNGDTAPATAATIATTATASSAVGSYAITASGAADANYNISYEPGTLTVEAVDLVITADDKTKAYGAALPELTVSYSGLVNGDTAPATVATIATTATASSAVGSYAITASGAADANYNISYVAGTLTVEAVDLVITADNKTKAYGAALPELTVSYSGLVNGDLAPATVATIATTATASSAVGSYAITASGAEDANYNISYVAGTLTVEAVDLVITADNKTKAYGAALPELTVSYSGLVNGDTAPATAATIATTATASSAVGSYAITASGAEDANYNISYVAGTLTVEAVDLVITADNKTKAYGAALPELTVSYSGLVNGDTAPATAATIATTATASSAVGSYAITASGAEDANYNISYEPGTLTVEAVDLVITADNKTKAYGAALPELTVSYSGLVNGDTAPATAATIATTATASSAVGSYAITASGAEDANYNISYVAGTLTVEAVDLVITADNKTKAYGAALPELTVSYSGLVNGDTAPATAATIATTATASSAVGSYAITASGAEDANYNISYVAGTLTVEAVDLLITADNKTKAYGAALPELTVSYSGLVNGDTAPATAATIATTATASSAVGSYAITASGAEDANYNISYVAGTLTVEAVDLLITADNKTKAYGAALPELTVSYSGLVNGDTAPATAATIATTATASSAVGSYAITASGAADANYNISYVAGTLTVEAVDLVITADNKTKAYGAALPELTVSYSGLVNGDTAPATVATIATTATASSAVGSYAITASGAEDANYNISYVAGTLTVEAVDLVITADNKTKAYGAALPELTVSYSGLVNGDLAPATVATIATTATASSAVGSYAITASGAEDANYNISYVAGTLTVEAVDLVITADNKTKAYGAALPELTVSYSGLVNGDTAPATAATIATTATASSAGGSYAITASGAEDANYNISYVAGTLTVEAVDLVITADNKTKAYGAALPELTVSYSGLVNGDTAPATAATIATTATASSAVGSYAITASGAEDANYNISYVAGTLTVEAVDLVITANNQEKFCGQTVNFTGKEFTQVGLVNGDAISSATITSVGASSSASGGDSPYKILIGDAQGTGLANYIISYLPGSLIIKGVTIDASASSNPVRLGTAATLSAQVTPAVAGVSVTFTLSEYNATNAGTFAQSYTALTGTNGIATVSVASLPSDVYKVTAVAGGGCSNSEAYLPVYDPDGGFVTGGGWIYSQAGNMQGAQSSSEGKANFGFNAKYKNGKNNLTEVDGNTNFQFQAGDIHLKSLSHNDMSLVISGAKATYRGVGTVNGTGNHKFLLIAIDGDISGGGGVDKFRIKIWKSNSSEVLYDNQWISDENSNDATVLGGGSIVIHKPKSSGKTAEVVEKVSVTASEEPIVEILESMAVAPNPVREEARVRFSLIEDASVVLRVFDFNGREVERLFSGSVRAHEVKEVSFQRRNLMSGVYILKLTTDRGNSYDKQIIVE